MVEPTPMRAPSLQAMDEVTADREAVLPRAELFREIVRRLSRNDVEGAKELYCRCAEDIGYELIHVTSSGPVPPALARLFVESKDYYKAAQVFETLGELRSAAEYFALAEAYIPAAELYGQVGDVEMTAEMCEKGGSYSQAAQYFAKAGRFADAGRNYEKAGQGFDAGSAYAKAGDHKRALACLQKVASEDPEYARAVELLGPTLEEMGLEDLALSKYEEAVHAGDGAVHDDNIGLHYRLARLYERTGDVEHAKATYARILDHDLSFEDAQERYKTLKVQPHAPAATGTRAPERPEAPLVPTGSEVVVLEEDRSIIEKSVLFRGLSYAELRSILQLAERKTFMPRDVIVREGDAFPGLCLIDRGQVEICMKTEPGSDKVARLTRFGPGDHMGELTVIGAERGGRVFALASTEGGYYLVPRNAMKALLERSPALKAKLLENMMLALDLHLEQSLDVIKSLWSRRHRSS